jgi:hypothetical protein
MEPRRREAKWPETAINRCARIETIDYENQLNDDKQQNGPRQTLAH